MPQIMAVRGGRWRWAQAVLIFVIAGVGLLFSLSTTPPAVAADTQQVTAKKALKWLLLNQRANGAWGSNSSGEIAATAKAVEVLYTAGARGYSFRQGAAWLSNAETGSVDSLARQAYALGKVGLSASSQLTKLSQWKNTQKAWGAYAQYDVSFPDTLLGMKAKRGKSSSYYDYSETPYELCAVVRSQNTDGSWPYRPDGSTRTGVVLGAILPTTHAIRELQIAKTTYAIFSGDLICDGAIVQFDLRIDSALAWLRSQRRTADGGFGESNNSGEGSTVFSTILAYEILRPLADSYAGPALEYLLGRQSADGSWEGDAFLTSLILLNLPVAWSESDLSLPVAWAAIDNDKDSLPDDLETTGLLGSGNGRPDDGRWLANPFDGDLNLDGVVDAADVALAQMIVAGQTPTSAHLRHGDVTGPDGDPDGVIDELDVIRIQRKALGLEAF
jgi:hypothetical protein